MALRDLEGPHQVLIDACTQQGLEPQERRERFAETLRPAHLLTKAHESDPLLPCALLLPDWVGTCARAAFATRWAMLTVGTDEPMRLFDRFQGVERRTG